ncbi:TPA: hypothetical protein ACF499_006715, partial [Pseudomonas aeruginosa]
SDWCAGPNRRFAGFTGVAFFDPKGIARRDPLLLLLDNPASNRRGLGSRLQQAVQYRPPSLVRPLRGKTGWEQV